MFVCLFIVYLSDTVLFTNTQPLRAYTFILPKIIIWIYHMNHTWNSQIPLVGSFYLRLRERQKERERERERGRECIMKAQVPGVSMRPPPLTVFVQKLNMLQPPLTLKFNSNGVKTSYHININYWRRIKNNHYRAREKRLLMWIRSYTYHSSEEKHDSNTNVPTRSETSEKTQIWSLKIWKTSDLCITFLLLKTSLKRLSVND